jgi:hypothetical protein
MANFNTLKNSFKAGKWLGPSQNTPQSSGASGAAITPHESNQVQQGGDPASTQQPNPAGATDPNAAPAFGTSYGLPPGGIRPHAGLDGAKANPFIKLPGSDQTGDGDEEALSEAEKTLQGNVDTAQSELDKVNPQYDKMSQDLLAMAQQRTAGMQRRAESTNVQMGGRLGGAWMGAIRQASISGEALSAREQYNLNLQRQASYDAKLDRLFRASTVLGGLQAGREDMATQHQWDIDAEERQAKRDLDKADEAQKAENESRAEAAADDWMSGRVGDKDLQYSIKNMSAEQRRQLRDWLYQNDLSGKGNDIADVKAYVEQLTGQSQHDSASARKGRKPSQQRTSTGYVDTDGDGVADSDDNFPADKLRN